MKFFISMTITLTFYLTNLVYAAEFNPEEFSKKYFNAWTATQNPKATREDIEHYLSFLTDDIGHQHLPFDKDDSRTVEGKEKMRKGMNYYLGAHSEFIATLVKVTYGFNVIVLNYDTSSKGIHPQNRKFIESNYPTLEVLEIEDGKISVIRKYSE